jgi:hypothetical protein
MSIGLVNEKMERKFHSRDLRPLHFVNIGYEKYPQLCFRLIFFICNKYRLYNL